MPLSRFKILDLTRVRAGPTCVRQLADWGADVIKIEAPPDDKEALGGDRDGFDFQNLHRNKRSLTLNLKTDAGKEIFHRLVKMADVVVENYPELKANDIYLKMMNEIEEQNENVGAAISIFNRNVELFNNHIQIFPNNIVNTMTVGKKAVRPFRDAAALQNFDYRPNFN